MLLPSRLCDTKQPTYFPVACFNRLTFQSTDAAAAVNIEEEEEEEIRNETTEIFYAGKKVKDLMEEEKDNNRQKTGLNTTSTKQQSL